MAELKTKPGPESVSAFLETVKDEQKRKDSFTLLQIFKDVLGEEPRLWGGSIVGFGDYHYKSASGREGDWFRGGFSPRKQNFSLYLSFGGMEKLAAKYPGLGKYKTGQGCLYINKLSDINPEILKELIKECSTRNP